MSNLKNKSDDYVEDKYERGTYKERDAAEKELNRRGYFDDDDD